MKVLINFYASVSEQSVNDLINFITQQIAISLKNKDNPLDEIIIQISSSGGSSDHGLLAYNYLKQLNVKKTTIGMGNVDSAAVMIFLAGDERLAMSSCRFVLHEALTTIEKGVFNDTKLHEIANLNKRITRDYCSVISSVTGKSVKSVQGKVKNGKVMSSNDAIDYGLVLRILNTPYLVTLDGLNILMVNNPSLLGQSGNRSVVEN